MPFLAPPPTPVAEVRAFCDRPTTQFARVDPGIVKPRRLGELPPANLTLALYHSIGGCNAAIVVRYGVGANAQPRR